MCVRSGDGHQLWLFLAASSRSRLPTGEESRPRPRLLDACAGCLGRLTQRPPRGSHAAPQVAKDICCPEG